MGTAVELVSAQPTVAQPVSGQYSGMVSASEVKSQLESLHVSRTGERDETRDADNQQAEQIDPKSTENFTTRPLSRGVSNEDRLTKIEDTQQEMKREIELLRTELRDTKLDILSTLHQMQSNMTTVLLQISSNFK